MSFSKVDFQQGMKEAMPIMFGFIPLALVLGAQASQKGISAFEIWFLTCINFAGGSEFAAVSLWNTPLNIALIVAVTALINSRLIIMSAVISPFLKHLSKRRALCLLFFMCDEVWAMGLADAQRRQVKQINVSYYLGTAICLYLMWSSFSALGAYIGPIFGDLERYGFDIALTAVFLVLLKGMWKGTKASRPWLVSLIVAGVLFHTVSGAWYVLGGAISGVLASWFWSKD